MRGWRAALAVGASASVLAACTGPSGARTLAFFFDGVPPPRTAAAPPSGRPGEPEAVPVVRASEHGPYAAKLCDGCHEPGRANELVVPADQLCGRCHALDLHKKYVHGPLNAGGCVLCHDPHRSSHAYLLVADSSTFCVGCHERRALRPVDGHADGGPSCSDCHEAHMSDRQYLLR